MTGVGEYMMTTIPAMMFYQTKSVLPINTYMTVCHYVTEENHVETWNQTDLK